MPEESKVRARGAAGVGLILLASGCATFGGSGVPDVAGHYSGGVVVEGQAIEGLLEVTQAGPALTVTFQAPALDLRASGDGELAGDGSAHLQVAYDLQCPGIAEMFGDFTEDARIFRGRLVATDCSGELAGTFEFTR